jgi:hypothetical protein
MSVFNFIEIGHCSAECKAFLENSNSDRYYLALCSEHPVSSILFVASTYICVQNLVKVERLAMK